jgi:hypothetical protein
MSFLQRLKRYTLGAFVRIMPKLKLVASIAIGRRFKRIRAKLSLFNLIILGNI